MAGELVLSVDQESDVTLVTTGGNVAARPVPNSGGSSVTWADGLAGSTDTSQDVAEIRGNAGSGAPVPVTAPLTFPGTNPVSEVGQLRFNDDGVPFNVVGGWVTARVLGNDLSALRYDSSHGVLQIGFSGLSSSLPGWPGVEIAAVTVIRGQLNDTSQNSNTGGFFTFDGGEVSGILRLWDDDWTVMQEQGVPGKDGRRRPLGYNSTFQNTACNVFTLSPTWGGGLDNAVQVPTYYIVMWDFTSAAPAWIWAVWRVQFSFVYNAGVPQLGTIQTVTLVDEFPSGASTGVNPTVNVTSGQICVQVTPPRTNFIRWYAGIDMPQVSDLGND